MSCKQNFFYDFDLIMRFLHIFVLAMALSQSLHTAFIELTFVKLRNFNSVGSEHKTPMIDVSTMTALLVRYMSLYILVGCVFLILTR